MWETLLAKLLGWVPAPWSGVRLGLEASAKLCTSADLPYSFGGPEPRGPLHVDLTADVWMKTDARTAIRRVEASAAGQPLRARDFGGDLVLGPEGRAYLWTQLVPPEGEALKAKAGDRVKVKLLLTRGHARKLRLPIAADEGIGG